MKRNTIIVICACVWCMSTEINYDVFMIVCVTVWCVVYVRVWGACVCLTVCLYLCLYLSLYLPQNVCCVCGVCVLCAVCCHLGIVQLPTHEHYPLPRLVEHWEVVIAL